MTWTYRPDTTEYEDHFGKRHGDDDKREWLWALLLALGLIMDELARRVAAGEMTAAAWEAEVMDTLADGYVAAYLLGRGGYSLMTDADYEAIAELLSGQGDFLAGFGAALPELSEAQIVARLRLYVNATQQAFWTAEGKGKLAAGFTEERWNTTPAEHCSLCPEFEAEGWKPIGYFPEPGDGSTPCGANCACHKEYR